MRAGPCLGRSQVGGASAASDAFVRWIDAAFERWLGELTWSEIARALGALSRDYVERRGRLQADDILAGRGKRAAFALYYASRHFLTVREIARRVEPPPRPRIVDLGCGLGVAGAAWSLAIGGDVPV